MKNRAALLTVMAALALLAACSKPSTTEPATETAPPAGASTPATEPPVADTTAPAPAAAPAPPASPPKAAVPRPATPRDATEPRLSPPPPRSQPVVLTVPAGTTLPLSLSTALDSKTAKVGDPVSARLTSDVMVDGRTAIASGTTVAGSIVKVVSGSAKVGGTPTLAISFDILEMPGGQDVPISGEITQKGKSDTGRDTVKIVGGTAAGALIGDKVIKGKKGKFIGGLLGGAVGAVAAQKTGTEVQMEEGTALAVTLDAPVEITRP